jgi:hypothetical protein
VFRIIPAEYLSVFEPHELEMILNGPHIIDLSDWKANTIYEGFKANDQVVRWFW